MQSLIAAAGSSHAGQKCRLCNRTVKPGQSIIVDTVTELRFGTGRTRRFHTACLRDLVDGAPAGVDELDAQRNLILATGNPYA